MAISKLILATQNLDLGKSSENEAQQMIRNRRRLRIEGGKRGGTIDGMWHALGDAYLTKHEKWGIIS